MTVIETKELEFDYVTRGEEARVTEVDRAIGGASPQIKTGSLVAILEHNGSGKSTPAEALNDILLPSGDTVLVSGMNAADDAKLLGICREIGMVFQNPDNQIIANLVKDDVGPGPENLGVPTEEIWQRVDAVLKAVDMTAFRPKSPNHLSGRQKQRVAIIGVMAMHPRCIVLDEPTVMLNPSGRKEVIRATTELNRSEDVTVVLTTRYMEEIIGADRLVVMDDGRVIMGGTPQEVFVRVEELKRLRPDVPQVTELAYELRRRGVSLPDSVFMMEEPTEVILPFWRENQALGTRIEHLSCTYGGGAAFVQPVLHGMSFNIPDGQSAGLIGHTGSREPILIQHLNGLTRVVEGRLFVDGENTYEKGYNMCALRTKVGPVFQYPGHQLSEINAFRDVCFGPKNMGLSEDEIEQRARGALGMIGLPESFYKKSSSKLSSDQKRRVAITGVLAMRPKVLVLDEPIAGLDLCDCDEILGHMKELNHSWGPMVTLVFYNMEDVAKYAGRLLMISGEEKRFDGTPKEVSKHYAELEVLGLSTLQTVYLVQKLRKAGMPFSNEITTVVEARDTPLSLLKGGASC